MSPPEPGTLDTLPVSKAVNNVRNNSPSYSHPSHPTRADTGDV
jgi:hypothetical protein